MRWLTAFGAVFVLLLLLALTNPGADAHRHDIAETYAEQNPISGAVGVGDALGITAEYHNYVVFSTTRLGPHRVSIGALGGVRSMPPSAEQLSTLVLEKVPPPVKQRLLQALPRWVVDRWDTP